MPADRTVATISQYAEFCARAAGFDGRPRERMVAIGEADELYCRLYPHHYRALQLVRVASQVGKPAGHSRTTLQHCESRVVAILMSVIQDAVACGDLTLRPPQRSEELAFSVWSLVFGARALMNTAVATSQLGITDGYDVARGMAELLFDELGWRPLSSEWDYARVRHDVRHTLFAAEWPTASVA
jgi:hypothetical protein